MTSRYATVGGSKRLRYDFGSIEAIHWLFVMDQTYFNSSKEKIREYSLREISEVVEDAISNQ